MVPCCCVKLYQAKNQHKKLVHLGVGECHDDWGAQRLILWGRGLTSRLFWMALSKAIASATAGSSSSGSSSP